MLLYAGPVMLGLLQACKSIAIFILSALLFCSQQASQCYTTEKTVATVLVVAGVTLYSVSKPKASGPVSVTAGEGKGKKSE